MSGAVLVCNDIDRDFERLETREINANNEVHRQNGSIAVSTASDDVQATESARRRRASVNSPANIEQRQGDGLEQLASKPYRLVWQGFPHGRSWLHLLDWTVDVITSFRGVGWKHRISIAGPIDALLASNQSNGEKKQKHESQNKTTSNSVHNLQSFQSWAVKDFVLNCLILDLLKTTAITDPYFLGLAPLESPTPWIWLARLNRSVPIATRFARLLFSMAGVISALNTIFSLSPLFFATVLPRLVDISTITRAPLLEPGLYPRMWQPLSTSVLRSGLAGFWGRFWHQMFRFGISEPSRVLIKTLELDPRGGTARVLQLSIAFGLSGSIHALGSYTTFSLQQGHPISGPLSFFLLQGIGILLQTSTVKWLNSSLAWTKRAPAPIRQTLNLLFVLVWLYFTGPLLANDFARIGIWLFEPVPVSLFRGLGFGPGGKDEGWWTWYQEGSRLLSWWKGAHWWNTALAIY